MAEIAYLVRPPTGTSAFVDQAADHYAAVSGVTVVDTATSLESVLADLRARATGGEVFQVVDLVCEDTGTLALPFPVSEARRGVDSGRITAATLQAALRNAGGPGYPAAAGAPAVTEATTVRLHGPDVGHDVGFVTRLAQLFGPSLTFYAPLVPEVIGGDLTRYRRTVLSGERAPSTHTLDVVSEPTPVEEPMSQLFGKYRGRVVDVEDPEAQGRLNVSVPAAGDPDTSMWAVACLPPIPSGLVRTPEIGSEVWVEFEGGDPTLPIWTGVTFGTTYDPEKDLTIEAEGNVSIVAGKSLTVQSGMASSFTAGTEVNMTGADIARVISGTVVAIEAGGSTTIKSSGVRLISSSVTVDSETTVFSGNVNAQTVVASTGIVSPSYTPGAGNVW